MLGKLLVAVYQVDADRTALETAASLASDSGGVVRVVHVREGDCAHGHPYLETADEAWDVVNEAVFELRMAGVGASGEVRRSRLGHVGEAIVAEAAAWRADAIVLGAGRSTFLARLPWRRTVIDRVRCGASVPVIVAPAASVPTVGDELPLWLIRTAE